MSSQATPSAVFARVQASLLRQGMMQHLGVSLISAEPGRCVLAMPYTDKVTQQQGGFHGGAMGALADIAGGYAGLTVAPEGMEIVTVEYKINFISACQGGELRATGQVLKAGKRIIIASAEVLHLGADGQTRVCAAMQQTLMPVPQNY
jgi:uncharacterized protein (TIGR00369 family)